MNINANNFNDALVTKAHVGFMLIAIVTILAKDSITSSLATSVFFISIALPLLILTLALMPHDSAIPKWQVICIAIIYPAGHLAGVAGFAALIWSINHYASIVFMLVTVFAFGAFSVSAAPYGYTIAELIETISIEEDNNNA